MNEGGRQRVRREMVRMSERRSLFGIARGTTSRQVWPSREACVRPMRLGGWKNVRIAWVIPI